MGIIVCKFGGTSTANAGMLEQIWKILKQDPARRYIVLSAPGRADGQEKVTDMLVRAWSDRDGEAVVRRFEGIARGLKVDMDFKTEIEKALTVSEAMTMSRGEYLCAKLFSAYTGLPFADAAGLIHFDKSGRLDEAKTHRAVRNLAAIYPRAVIPGFYGADPDGNIVTFPRNGSDITGALVAAGVGASIYENWTDVPGLMTGDPAADPNARPVPAVTYAQMRALSAQGVQVLHPDCLAPVERAGIPTIIKCTMDPGLPGTIVH